MCYKVTKQKVRGLAADYFATLLANDDRFARSVVVNHQDGTAYRFECASAYTLNHPDFLSDREREAIAFWKAQNQRSCHQVPSGNFPENSVREQPAGEEKLSIFQVMTPGTFPKSAELGNVLG